MKPTPKIGRREFLGAAAAGGLMVMKPGLVRSTAANSALRVGLLGCGGRGTEDATDMVETGLARIVALADIFKDQLEKARTYFDDLAQKRGYAHLDTRQLYVGPRAFEQIVASKELDAVVIATPPFFHPQHLKAAVAADKHVYLEKPVAVDVRGAKEVIETGRRAQGRLSLEVGFQIRNAPPFVELTRRIHAGALGRIACGQAYYYATTIERPAWPNARPAERRLRNWVYDRVLSGDILVEQNIHVIDVCNWVLEARPLKASAVGGRGLRTDSGDCWGHFEVLYTYPEEVQVSFNSTQTDKGWWDVCERFFGSKGISEAHYSRPVRIVGEEPWEWETPEIGPGEKGSPFSTAGVFQGALDQADSEKKKAFIESITSGQFHNQAEQGAESALSAMLGRRAAYSGRETTWNELWSSNEHWGSGLNLEEISKAANA